MPAQLIRQVKTVRHAVADCGGKREIQGEAGQWKGGGSSIERERPQHTGMHLPRHAPHWRLGQPVDFSLGFALGPLFVLHERVHCILLHGVVGLGALGTRAGLGGHARCQPALVLRR